MLPVPESHPVMRTRYSEKARENPSYADLALLIKMVGLRQVAEGPALQVPAAAQYKT